MTTNEAKEAACDYYCRFPRTFKNQEIMQETECKFCKLMRFLEDVEQEPVCESCMINYDDPNREMRV